MSTEIITLMVWGEDFEQELRPLIKAFYPGAQFQVTKETWDGCPVKDAASFLRILKEQDAPFAVSAGGIFCGKRKRRLAGR